MGLLGAISSGIKGLFVLSNIASLGLALLVMLALRGQGIYLTAGLLSPLTFLVGENLVDALALCADFLIVMFFASIAVFIAKWIFGGSTK